MWNRDIYKKIKKRKYEKQLADIANFVTEEEIFKIDETLRYLNTHTANACAELSRSHFTRVRDYMLTNLILNNASRPATIHNMALHEFKSAKKQDENFVVPVINHKTGHISPAAIVSNNALHSSTVGYIEFVRKKPYANEMDEALVFVTYGGMKMGSSLISSQLRNFLESVAGVTEEE